MAYFETTKLKDSNGNLIDPAEKQTLYNAEPEPNSAAPVVRTLAGSVDDEITLLRRIMKLIESQAATDGAQRQRIVVETLPTLAAVTTVTTVTTVATVTSITNIAALNGWNQQMFADPARTAYNTGIRNQLTFG